jgi:hypothetical protein
MNGHKRLGTPDDFSSQHNFFGTCRDVKTLLYALKIKTFNIAFDFTDNTTQHNTTTQQKDFTIQRDCCRDFKNAPAEFSTGAALSSENTLIAEDGTANITGARFLALVFFFFVPPSAEASDGTSPADNCTEHFCSFCLAGDRLATARLAGARFAAAGLSAGGCGTTRIVSAAKELLRAESRRAGGRDASINVLRGDVSLGRFSL